MECLLAFIEITQLLQYLEGFLNEKTADSELVNFPQGIPQSAIIEKYLSIKCVDKLYNAKMMAYALYKKFIEVDSDFEINISFRKREQIKHILHDLETLKEYDIEMKDLYTLFIPSLKELQILLTYSLSRFKSTDRFAQILSLFPNV